MGIHCVSLGPPDFEEELADCTAELGETVKLACRVTGTPSPVVSWYKGRALVWVGGQGVLTLHTRAPREQQTRQGAVLGLCHSLPHPIPFRNHIV